MSYSTVVGARVKAVPLARVARWLAESGRYGKPRVGGVVARAVEELAALLFSCGIGHDIQTEEEALVVLGHLRLTGMAWEPAKPSRAAQELPQAGAVFAAGGRSSTRGKGKQPTPEQLQYFVALSSARFDADEAGVPFDEAAFETAWAVEHPDLERATSVSNTAIQAELQRSMEIAKQSGVLEGYDAPVTAPETDQHSQADVDTALERLL